MEVSDQVRDSMIVLDDPYFEEGSFEESTLTPQLQPARRLGFAKEASVAPWANWESGNLRPAGSAGVVTPQRIQKVERVDQDSEGCPLLDGLRPRPRSIVLQFVLELKLRAFGADRLLEQELRKRPSARFYLKMFPEYSTRRSRPAPW